MVVDIDADTDDVRHNRIASAADVMRAILIDWIGLDWRCVFEVKGWWREEKRSVFSLELLKYVLCRYDTGRQQVMLCNW